MERPAGNGLTEDFSSIMPNDLGGSRLPRDLPKAFAFLILTCAGQRICTATNHGKRNPTRSSAAVSSSRGRARFMKCESPDNLPIQQPVEKCTDRNVCATGSLWIIEKSGPDIFCLAESSCFPTERQA